MELAEWKRRLETPEGWYIFAGEEEYLKRHYLALLRDAVIRDEATAAFNYTVFDGPEPDVPALTEAVAALPFMSERRLVVWKYADFEKMKESTRAALDRLLERREKFPYTVLVFLVTAEGFDAGNPPKRPGKLYRRYEKMLDILLFPRSTQTQLLAWLKRHFDAAGIRVNAGGLNALLLRSGTAMDVLRSEVDKLTAYILANGRDTLTVQDVAEVACTVGESDTFALSGAIQSGDRRAAFDALEELRAEKTELPVLLGMLSRIYGELLAIALLLEEGCRTDDVAGRLGLQEWKVRKELPAVRRLGAARLREAVEELSRIDLQSKLGTSSYAPAEMFLARFL